MWTGARGAVNTLLRAGDAEACLAEWLAVFVPLYGRGLSEPRPGVCSALRRCYHVREQGVEKRGQTANFACCDDEQPATYAREIGVSPHSSAAPKRADFHRLLFCVHTYFALCARSAALRLGRDLFDSPEAACFRWGASVALPPAALPPARDAFKDLYQALVPRAVRHALGEYYTPDWLAELILDEIGYEGEAGRRFLDPSCGSGTFLVLAIERAKRRGGAAQDILRNIRGFELNPLAVLAARANYLLALGDLAREIELSEIPICRADSILEPVAAGEFDFVAGNPPWVGWDYLSREYRKATLPLWKRYGLFSLHGFQARLGAGKKDLSMLFTYAAADHYLKHGGTLGFVITQEAFKSKGAGEGFRRFRLGEDGPPLRVLKAHDFSKLRPFDGAANKTAAIILTKGEKTAYPVPYFVWQEEAGAPAGRGKCAGQARRPIPLASQAVARPMWDRPPGLSSVELQARPLDGRCSAWQTLPGEVVRSLGGRCPYKAMLGANPNPYGVFWLEVLEVSPKGVALVRNLVEKGRQALPEVRAWTEADLIYPAVRGGDIKRWGASPGVHMLIVQDPDTRRGYPEEALRRQWPRAWDYLSGFRTELLGRALYKKYHAEAGHAFYSQFNISRQTFAPHKVVWKRMSNDLTAAVISDWAGPLGRKAAVPLETTAFIAARSAPEAHYLCAVLNSRLVRDFVKSFSSAGRGFGTPSAIHQIAIPKFDERDPVHWTLAHLSVALHEERRGERSSDLEAQLDAAVNQLNF